jgi:hypothetical protein
VLFSCFLATIGLGYLAAVSYLFPSQVDPHRKMGMSAVAAVTVKYYGDRANTRLREMLGGACHPTFYLAVPPALFETVVAGLAGAGLTAQARVIVEKPFGRDLCFARKLNGVLRAALAQDGSSASITSSARKRS